MSALPMLLRGIGFALGILLGVGFESAARREKSGIKESLFAAASGACMAIAFACAVWGEL